MSGFRSLLSRLFGRRPAPPEPPATTPSAAAAPAPPATTPSAVAAEDQAGTISAPPTAPVFETESPEVARRAERVAERILSNERLTADLDDQAAQVLLDWALAQARSIASGTAGADDDAAQLAMSPRLVALERMARLVNRWATSGREDLLTSIMDQAALVYGSLPQMPQVAASSANEPGERIRQLRAAIEKQGT